MGVVTEAQVATLLDGVMDPHMKASITEIGMVRSISISSNNDLEIGLSFPCIGCPARELIHSDIYRQLKKLSGLGSIKLTDEWVNKWQPEDISERARENAREAGYLL